MSEKLIEEGRAGAVRVGKDDQANVDDVLQNLKEDFVSQSHAVDVTKTVQGKYVAMDGEWLSSILRSLIDNAYQHGGDDVAVTVACDLDRDSSNKVKIEVHNHGQQISDAIADKIFEPFFIMTRGGPGDSTRTFSLYLYQQAFERINEELADGQVVCIFPEGKLTRDGELAEFKTGMEKIVNEKGIKFDYLVDEKQDVAKKYGAICTPDPFLFDQNRKLIFHGRIDNAMNPDDIATENTMQENIEKYLAGEKIEKDFDPSIGCSIKWK